MTWLLFKVHPQPTIDLYSRSIHELKWNWPARSNHRLPCVYKCTLRPCLYPLAGLHPYVDLLRQSPEMWDTTITSSNWKLQICDPSMKAFWFFMIWSFTKAHARFRLDSPSDSKPFNRSLVCSRSSSSLANNFWGRITTCTGSRNEIDSLHNPRLEKKPCSLYFVHLHHRRLAGATISERPRPFIYYIKYIVNRSTIFPYNFINNKSVNHGTRNILNKHCISFESLTTL